MSQQNLDSPLAQGKDASGQSAESQTDGALAEIISSGTPFCSPERIVFEEFTCVTGTVAGRKVLNDIRATLYGPLQLATYQHNLAVSSYETDLQKFQAKLALFQSILDSYVAYLNSVPGRTYSTSLIDDWADQLEAQASVLVPIKLNLATRHSNLVDEAVEEGKAEEALKRDLKDLATKIADALAELRCINCTGLTFLAYQVTSLLTRSNFTIKRPSKSPSAIPTVLRLPAPPQPPNPAIFPAPQRKSSVSLGFSPSGNFLKRIEAGFVWPYILPPEGGTRFCVSVPYVFSPTVNPAQGGRYIPPVGPANPNDDFLGFQHEFGVAPLPSIRIGGGMIATDIAVSSDRTNLFFSIRPGSLISPGTYGITVEDGQLTIELASQDPKTSLTVVEDIQLGFASLEFGVLIAIDSIYQCSTKYNPSWTDVGQWYQPFLNTYRSIFAMISARYRAGQCQPELMPCPMNFAAVAGPHLPPNFSVIPGSFDVSGSGYPYFASTDWAYVPPFAQVITWIASRFGSNTNLDPPKELADIIWEMTKLYSLLMPSGDTVAPVY